METGQSCFHPFLRWYSMTTQPTAGANFKCSGQTLESGVVTPDYLILSTLLSICVDSIKYLEMLAKVSVICIYILLYIIFVIIVS